jgi:hypothetical protein
VTVTSSTISGNNAIGGGGGIYNNAGQATVRNTIIAKNTAEQGPDVYLFLSSLGFNLIGNNSGSTIPPTIGDHIGTSGSPH